MTAVAIACATGVHALLLGRVSGRKGTRRKIGLVAFTALGFLFTSMKLPHYGVAANLVGQIFWLYSSYRAWREADQIGIFILTICITLILLYGVANYWL